MYENFNTSYVVIKRLNINSSNCRLSYFNTSYVVIKQFHTAAASLHIFISIHLMLLLNQIYKADNSDYSNFNTSYVVIKHCLGAIDLTPTSISIHLMLLLNLCDSFIFARKKVFQYILCCY